MQALTDTMLAPLTTLQLGGPAQRLVAAASAEELVAVVADADRAGAPVLVLAGGSNVVIADDGFPGTVALVRSRGVSVQRDGSDRVLVIVQAGEVWDDLVARTVADRLAGLECLSGIPGSVGATPIQNVGAYGQEVAETVIGVRAYDRHGGRVVQMAPADCGFGYRSSAFKGTDRYVVLQVSFALTPTPLSRPIRYPELARRLEVPVGGQVELGLVREQVLATRRSKGMVLDPTDPDTRSVGSFFTNPVLPADRLPEGAPAWPADDGLVKTSAAWLIEHAGFGRGQALGTARVSSKHVLALTNPGEGSTEDLLALARQLRDGVQRRYGIELVNEPVLVGAGL